MNCFLLCNYFRSNVYYIYNQRWSVYMLKWVFSCIRSCISHSSRMTILASNFFTLSSSTKFHSALRYEAYQNQAHPIQWQDHNLSLLANHFVLYHNLRIPCHQVLIHHPQYHEMKLDLNIKKDLKIPCNKKNKKYKKKLKTKKIKPQKWTILKKKKSIC